METASSLMYAANKYMLPKLVRECGRCLSDGLNVDNVIEVLEQSLLFNDKELQSKCLEFIGNNAKVVLTGSEILSASPQTMDSILNVDELSVKEIVVYETCIVWAKHQLQSQIPTENPTDEMIREVLGDLLYKIRFPSMKLTEFAEIVQGNNILTAEEKASIYGFLATYKKDSGFLFSTVRRIGEENWIERTVAPVQFKGAWYPRAGVDAINFITDRNILLTGVGLFMGYSVLGGGYVAIVQILHSNNSLFQKKLTVPGTIDAKQFKVSLDVPILICAGVVYSIKTLVTEGEIAHRGYPCQAVCKKDNVTFTFSSHPESKYTTEFYGQIPRLYFILAEKLCPLFDHALQPTLSG